jgi:hypothetical protein
MYWYTVLLLPYRNKLHSHRDCWHLNKMYFVYTGHSYDHTHLPTIRKYNHWCTKCSLSLYNTKMKKYEKQTSKLKVDWQKEVQTHDRNMQLIYHLKEIENWHISNLILKLYMFLYKDSISKSPWLIKCCFSHYTVKHITLQLHCLVSGSGSWLKLPLESHLSVIINFFRLKNTSLLLKNYNFLGRNCGLSRLS